MKLTALLPRQRRALACVAVVAALTVPFSAAPSGAAVHCNTAPVVFTPPGQPTFAVLPWQPYPSTINVQGESGVVTDVNVTFNDFTYEFPEDVDVLLVAPDGSTRLLVFSDIGGNNDDVANPVSNVDLTFDDEAGGTPATDSQLVSGTYRPTDDDDDASQVFGPDQFVPPAPSAGEPGTATSLSVFDGINPNGTWSLYVVDDEPGPPIGGGFGTGWCLNITTSGTPTSSTPSSSTPSSTTPTSSTLPTTSTTLGTSTTQATTSTTQATTSTTQATTSTTQATTSTTLGTTTTQATTTTTVPPTTTSTTVPATTTTSSTTTTTPAGTCGGLTPTIVGTDAGEIINGTPGDDVIVGRGGNDTIHGGGGNDTICGGDGNDQITGDDGNDRLFGDAGNDRLVGGGGNDTLDGGLLFDQCFGDDGTDTATACEQVFTVP